MITLTAAVIALLGAFLLLAGGYLTWLGGVGFIWPVARAYC